MRFPVLTATDGREPARGENNGCQEQSRRASQHRGGPFAGDYST